MTTPPGRPDHPDFQLISHALLGIDARSESGQDTSQILDGMIDPDSALYAAVQRASFAAKKLPKLRPHLSALAGAWLDGLLTGLHVQQEKTPARAPGNPEAAVAGELVREILEALCRQKGISLDSEAEPGTPARNFELALRLGIGEVFGIT